VRVTAKKLIAAGKRINVLVNGVVVDRCFEFDAERGYAKTFMHRNGKLVLCNSGEEILTQIHRGFISAENLPDCERLNF
jgi:hypothetical protein